MTTTVDFAEAVARGITASGHGEYEAEPVYRTIRQFVEPVVDLLYAQITGEQEEEFVENLSELIASEPLLVKLLQGFYAETAVRDNPPADGVVGTAVDQAMAVLEAYKR